MSVTRRDVLKVGSLGVLGALGLGWPAGSLLAREASRLPENLMPKPYAAAFRRPPLAKPLAAAGRPGEPRTKYYDLAETAGAARIIAGKSTPIRGYNGTFPGPTIVAQQGNPVVMRMRNKMPGPTGLFGQPLHTSTHLHGSASLPQYDGYASDVTLAGQYKDYRYPNFQPARTLWYHDHGVHITAENVFSGLAAQYHLHDPWERKNLPQGALDVPLTVSDAMFAENGSLLWDPDSSGLWGDVVLVNGAPWPVMKVQRRVYRFRMLNASISRSYRPTLSTGDPVTMVATDGGVMPRAQQVTSWRHAPAERYEFLVDFSRYRSGQRVELRNLSNENNRDYDHTDKIMAFDVVGDPVTSDPWRKAWGALMPSAVMNLDPAKAVRTTRLRLERTNGSWTINGTTWRDVVDSNFQKVVANPALGDVEIWEIENSSGGWFHPLHIHLVDFKVLSRNGAPPFPYELGPKDVVYVGENETVRLLMQFGPHEGRYMVHCHNLPHEDHDMMSQFRVGPAGGPADVANDPRLADPPKKDDGRPL